MWTFEGAVVHMAGFAEQGVDSLDYVELADGIINAFWPVQHILESIFKERGPGSDERGDVTPVSYTHLNCSAAAFRSWYHSKMVRRTPVSYTHLDVYKRQFRSCFPESTERRLPITGNG